MIPLLKAFQTQNISLISLLLWLMIPWSSFSQGTELTITLPKTQWIEIREGLEKGKYDAKMVEILNAAIEKAEQEMEKSKEIITDMKRINNNLDRQIDNYRAALYNLQTAQLQAKNSLLLEQSKRFGLSAIMGGGYGTGSPNPQLFIGAGVTYQILKF